MRLKQMKFESMPSDIESHPLCRSPIGKMDLAARTERLLREGEFETAGDVASRSAEELTALLYFTPRMIAEIEDALERLGLTLREG